MRYLIAVLLTACVASPDPYNTPTEAPANLERAGAIVVAAWGERLGVELGDLPSIAYYEGCLIYPDEHMKQEWYSGCILGRYFSVDESVHVTAASGAETDALSHELLHWALDVAGEHDEGHTHPLFDEIDDVQGLLKLDALCLSKYDTATCDALSF